MLNYGLNKRKHNVYNPREMTKHCKSCRRDLEESEFIENKVFKTCNGCRKKQNGNNRKLTLEECQEFAKSKGGKCLSTEYKNNKTKMLWQCSEKHEWSGRFDSIKHGHWCPHCVGCAKLTIEECQTVAASKGGKCLSTEYNSNKSKMSWQCSEKHEWNATFDCIKSGSWCPHCYGLAKLTIEECQEFAESKDGKCLSTEYKNSGTKMLWQCSEKHTWGSKFCDIKYGHWCPHCAGLAKLTIEECQEFAKTKNGKCLSTEYKNTNTKMIWQCSENHEWSAVFNNIKSGHWCPRCAGSKSEELCRTIIEKYLCEPFPNVRPKFLEGLELDGYNEDLNIAFEYNGIQHYEYNEHFHRGDPELFEKQKERDLKKYAICAERGINLIIIPYQYDYSKPKELENFIFNALWKIS